MAFEYSTETVCDVTEEKKNTKHEKPTKKYPIVKVFGHWTDYMCPCGELIADITKIRDDDKCPKCSYLYNDDEAMTKPMSETRCLIECQGKFYLVLGRVTHSACSSGYMGASSAYVHVSGPLDAIDIKKYNDKITDRPKKWQTSHFAYDGFILGDLSESDYIRELFALDNSHVPRCISYVIDETYPEGYNYWDSVISWELIGDDEYYPAGYFHVSYPMKKKEAKRRKKRRQKKKACN